MAVEGEAEADGEDAAVTIDLRWVYEPASMAFAAFWRYKTGMPPELGRGTF